MNNFQYVYKLYGDSNNLPIFLNRQATEIDEELGKGDAVFGHYVIATLDIILSSAILVGEIVELEHSVTDDARDTVFV